MAKMVGFGDYLSRLSPLGYKRFIQASMYEVNYTGAEANVCVSLSCMGIETEFVTRLPDNDIARAALSEMLKYRVKVDHVAWGGERMGLFYLEKGASQRPSRIVYDRKYTSIATASYEDFDWEAIFGGATHFHITGITPALGPGMPELCLQVIQKASDLGVSVSCDLNYRKNMWTPDEAKACMEKIVPHVDLLIANEEDADKVLGIQARDSNVVAGKLCREGYVEVAEAICNRFGVKEVGITLRRSITASDNEWGALLYAGHEPYFSRSYPIHIVDRVGGGDSFAAGLLYGSMTGMAPQERIEYAAAASCLKHSIEQDFNLVSEREVKLLLSGDGTGRVQR